MGPFVYGCDYGFLHDSGINAVENVCVNMSAKGKAMLFFTRLKSKSKCGSPSGAAERLHLI